MKLHRRTLLKQAGMGALAAAGATSVEFTAKASCRRVNGSGSYLLGPFEHAQDKSQQVFLTTDLGFDETIVFCKVTTNFEPLLFPTAKLGVVELGAHEFFMDMQSTRIDSLEIVEGSDGPQAVFSGVLRSETRLFSGERMQTFVEESAIFGCHAVQLGPKAAVQTSRNNFSMTALFDPKKEHAAIFGEVATFAGRLARGNILVVP